MRLTTYPNALSVGLVRMVSTIPHQFGSRNSLVENICVEYEVSRI